MLKLRIFYDVPHIFEITNILWFLEHDLKKLQCFEIWKSQINLKKEKRKKKKKWGKKKRKDEMQKEKKKHRRHALPAGPWTRTGWIGEVPDKKGGRYKHFLKFHGYFCQIHEFVLNTRLFFQKSCTWFYLSTFFSKLWFCNNLRTLLKNQLYFLNCKIFMISHTFLKSQIFYDFSNMFLKIRNLFNFGNLKLI